jgi:hypothetical protein
LSRSLRLSNIENSLSATRTGRRAKLADRPPPRQMGMGRWV